MLCIQEAHVHISAKIQISISSLMIRVIFLFFRQMVSRDSTVSIATGYGLDD
jgi:hypothetical protein